MDQVDSWEIGKQALVELLGVPEYMAEYYSKAIFARLVGAPFHPIVPCRLYEDERSVREQMRDLASKCTEEELGMLGIVAEEAFQNESNLRQEG